MDGRAVPPVAAAAAADDADEAEEEEEEGRSPSEGCTDVTTGERKLVRRSRGLEDARLRALPASPPLLGAVSARLLGPSILPSGDCAAWELEALEEDAPLTVTAAATAAAATTEPLRRVSRAMSSAEEGVKSREGVHDPTPAGLLRDRDGLEPSPSPPTLAPRAPLRALATAPVPVSAARGLLRRPCLRSAARRVGLLAATPTSTSGRYNTELREAARRGRSSEGDIVEGGEPVAEALAPDSTCSVLPWMPL